MRLDSAISDYSLQLRAAGRSVHTLGQVQRHLNEFARWLSPDVDLDSISTTDIARFMVADATTNRRSTATLNAIRSSLRTAFAFMHSAGYARSNPARLLKLSLRSPLPPRALADDQIARLTSILANARGRNAARDRTIVAVMLLGGLRLGSTLGLDIEDVDLDRRELTVRVAKGDQAARTYVCLELANQLRAHIGERTSGPLFVRTDGARVGRRQVQRIVEQRMRAAGIAKGSSHSCRHSFAAAVYARCGDVLIVKAALGHRSVSSTMAYTQARPADVRRAIEA